MALRIGGICLILAGFLSILGLILHPQTTPSLTQAHFSSIAQSSNWRLIHILIIFARILYIPGFLTLHLIQKDQSSQNISKLALYFSLVGTATSMVLTAIDGFALKTFANFWYQSFGEEKINYFNLLLVLQEMETKMFNIFVIIYFGIAFILYGLSFYLSKIYPRSVSLLPIIFSTFVFFLGLFHLLFNFTPVSSKILGIFLILQNLWMFSIGIAILRNKHFN